MDEEILGRIEEQREIAYYEALRQWMTCPQCGSEGVTWLPPFQCQVCGEEWTE